MFEGGMVVWYLRDSVDQMRSLALAHIPVLEDVFKASFPIRQHSFIVYRYRHDIESAWPCCLDGIHVGKLLDQQTFPIMDPIAVLGPRIA